MDTQSPKNSETPDQKPIHQPLTPQDVPLEQIAAHRRILETENPTVNPGDQVNEEKTLEEKSQQVAVNAGDITGDHIVVPTYFIVDYPDGERKALHHVKDAEEISDVIRQARVNEDGERTWA